jgi:TonB-dependent receptor
MRMFLNQTVLTILTSVLFLAPVTAQDRKGTIAGQVTDVAHGVLKGARVELQPKGQQTVTDGQGQFTLSDLAPGDYTLTISYVGFAELSKAMKVTGGQVSRVDAQLQVAATTDSITVTAERPRGEALALNQERTADNILQVLPAEVITSLPNTNVADALGRLPSVSLERDEGEGKYVQIRGTEPRLSNVTINGVNVPSPEGNVRNIKLDVIPADLVETIEVSKTLSANQDGDAIGGSINLVTKTAGDQRFLSLSGLGGYTPIVGGRGLDQFGGTYGQRFGRSKRFGALFGGSYDYNGRGINDIEPGPAVTGTMDIREYRYNRHRYGFAGGADYRLGAGSSAYVRGLYSRFLDYGDTWVYTPNINTFLSPTLGDTDGNMAYRHYIRRPDQRIYSLSTGARHNLGATLIDYEFSVSHASQDTGFPTTSFNGPDNIVFGLDLSNPNRPVFKVLNGVNIYDPSKYTLSNTSVLSEHSHQLNYSGAASLARHYAAGSHFGSFAIGFKVRDAHKTQNNNDKYYNAVGAPITLSAVQGSFSDSNYYNNTYQLGPLSDYNKILSVFNNNPGQFQLDANTTNQRSNQNNYDTGERVIAGYLMNTIDFGRIRLQTGLRFEGTESAFTGYHVTLDSKGNYASTTPMLGNQTYTDVLPSVQLIYKVDQDTNIRAVYGRGIARPHYGDLPPYIVENDKRRSLSAGNPALTPTRANNYDLLIERYLKPIGIVQAGYFYKDLSDPIYSTQTQLTSGSYAGYLQTQPVNGPSAHIQGFEAAWQQRLSFFPGLLKSIGVNANYSYTSSRATVPGRTDKPALVRQGPNNWNLGMTYDKGPFSMRFGVSHNDAYIYSYNYRESNSGPYDYTDGSGGGLKGPNGDVYLFAHTQFDVQGSYQINRALKLTVAGLNLSNEFFGFYQGSPQFPIQREYYHPTVMVGFRWTPIAEK